MFISRCCERIYGESESVRESDAKKAWKTYAKARVENKSTTTLYMKREKLPRVPNTIHPNVRGELQHFRPYHDRIRRRSVQMSVTEVVDVLCAEDFVPAKNYGQHIGRHAAQRKTANFSWIWPGTISIERYFPQSAQR